MSPDRNVDHRLLRTDTKVRVLTGFSQILFKRARCIVATFPATILITSIVLIIAYFTAGTTYADHRILVDDVGLDLGKVLSWQLWTLPASTVIQSDPGIGPKLAALIVVSLAAIEYLAGSVRATVTFFLSDWISAPLTVLVAWPLAHLGIDRAYNVLYRPDTGSSAAALGALAAAMVFLPPRWRSAALGLLFAILIYMLPTPGLSANIAHFLGALTGMLIGLIWSRQLSQRRQSNTHLTTHAMDIWHRCRLRWSRSDV